eukprot:45624-Eustigmatos_ZCMA.PRE.1
MKKLKSTHSMKEKGIKKTPTETNTEFWFSNDEFIAMSKRVASTTNATGADVAVIHGEPVP